MYGERDAAKRLPDRRQGERSPDGDLDPSFPKLPPSWLVPHIDLYGDVDQSTESWVGSGFTPDWNALRVVAEINGQPGPWVLLDGYVCGRNKQLDRELFAFTRGLLVAAKDVDRLESAFLAKDYPGNGSIPTGVTEHYLYAGEVGRLSRYARHLIMPNGTYRRQLGHVFTKYSWEQADRALDTAVRVRYVRPGGAGENDSIIEIPIVRHTKPKRIQGIQVELPTGSFEWESHHSTQNTFTGFFVPAPRLIQFLNLATRNREVDFYDVSGNPAVLYREHGSEWNGDRHRLLYIRADLLRTYLTNTRQKLSWCIWGERDWTDKMDGLSVKPNAARMQLFGDYKHIHRDFAVWDRKG